MVFSQSILHMGLEQARTAYHRHPFRRLFSTLVVDPAENSTSLSKCPVHRVDVDSIALIINLDGMMNM